MPEDRGRGVVDRGAAGRCPAGAVPAAGERRVSACGCDDIDALMETVRRSTVQIIREIERQHGVPRQYDVQIVRKSA